MGASSEAKNQSPPGLNPRLRIGTAGWNLPKDYVSHFPAEGSHLERYAGEFNAVEINSSFYRDHQASTYARWATSTPAEFLFSVKLNRYFTHETKLTDSGARLEETLAPILGLGSKLGVLLVQLPPKLEFNREAASRFFSDLRDIYSGPIALEPRHVSWLKAPPLINQFSLSWVEADPQPFKWAKDLNAELGALITSSSRNASFKYIRWHGSPEIYKSRYDDKDLSKLELELQTDVQAGDLRHVWCIFDNTTFGFATENAWQLKHRLNFTAGQPIARIT